MTDEKITVPATAPIWMRRIAQIVSERGGSWRGVSLAAGLGETYVRDIVRKNGSPNVSRLKKLADFHGVDLAWFFTEDTTDRDQEMIRTLRLIFQSLEPPMQEFLLKSARDLLEAQKKHIP